MLAGGLCLEGNIKKVSFNPAGVTLFRSELQALELS